MVLECAWCPNRRILGFVRGGKGITSGMCKKCEHALQEGTWKQSEGKRGR
jgi:hypothetical protein